FDSAWLQLPQPVGMRRAFDGPRTDVADVTQWVYYPVSGAVPPGLRGHVAAVRDAVGSVTRFEAYDAFGNATRVVDPNGVATSAPSTTTTGPPESDRPSATNQVHLARGPWRAPRRLRTTSTRACARSTIRTERRSSTPTIPSETCKPCRTSAIRRRTRPTPTI